jgi:hypothetical protein
MPTKPCSGQASFHAAALIALVCLAVGCPSKGLAVDQARGLTLVDAGQPAATIVVAAAATVAEPTGPSAKIASAARELQAYIQKISAATLPIVSDATSPTGPLILVGRSRFSKPFDEKIPKGVTDARREEGFVIVCRGARLLLAGNDDGPYHGTEYAVYELLERLGVRWFMPGEFGQSVPRRETIHVPPLDLTQKPDFVIRNWWLHTTPEMAQLEDRWKLRNKMNTDSMFAIPGDTSARRIVDTALFEEHPEYFALNADGSRNQHLPNLSHPKAVAIAADIIKAHFRTAPKSNSYGFAPDDGMPRDYDPQTLKRNAGFVEVYGRPGVAAEMSTTEEWITFVNNVAAEVHKQFPGRYIATNGYANRNIPPQGVTLDDHLVIMFAAIWSDTLHAYDDPKSWQAVRQGQMLRAWARQCPNVWVYGYNYVNLVSALTPVPRTRKLARDFPLMKQWGVMGFFDETRNIWAECGITTRYLRAKLEWDADADVNAILDDFYTRWYGQAAAPAQAFWNALEDAIEQTPMLGHEDRILPYVYSPALLAKLNGAIVKADALAATARTRLHVQVDRLILEHLEAYMAMRTAAFAARFADAANSAGRMLDLRKQLHQINSFFIMPHEDGYKTGVWYWKITDRKKYYQMLADKLAGKTGDLLAILPDEARFRTDPHDEGRFAGWYAPTHDDRNWQTLSTTKPFYAQGHMDAAGHPYLGHIWYRLQVDVPAEAAGRKVMLYAPIVETQAWAWVNGRYVGHRPYREAYIRPAQMELDVTDAIRPGQVNRIVLRVHTSLNRAAAASGLMSRMFLYAPKP